MLKRALKLSDISLLVVGMCSQTAQIFPLAFATHDWLVYLSALLGLATYLTYPATVAFAAHLTGPEEVSCQYKQYEGFPLQIGVLSTGYFTLTYLTIGASQAIFQPLFIATQHWFRGLVFLITGSISALTILLVLYMRRLDKEDRNAQMDQYEELQGKDRSHTVDFITNQAPMVLEDTDELRNV